MDWEGSRNGKELDPTPQGTIVETVDAVTRLSSEILDLASNVCDRLVGANQPPVSKCGSQLGPVPNGLFESIRNSSSVTVANLQNVRQMLLAIQRQLP
jgi:hypothetical protein